MNNPAISVIVPMYNVERYIKICIDSILGQTFQDFEIIIVDDASPDNSYKICSEIYGNNEKVRIVRHEKNQGSGSARNTGIENAHGKYIYFVDSDDAVLPQALEILYNVAEKTGSDVVHTSRYFETEQDDDKPFDVNRFKLSKEPHQIEGFLNPNILYRWQNCWRHWNDADGIRAMSWLIFCRREIFTKFPLRFEPIISEDELFSFEILTYIQKFFTINQAVYVNRHRTISSILANDPQRLAKGIRALFVTIDKMNFVMNNFPELRDKTDFKERFINRLLEAHCNNHIIPFYKNGLDAGSTFVINTISNEVFGKYETFVKYFFNGFNLMHQQNNSLVNRINQLNQLLNLYANENLNLNHLIDEVNKAKENIHKPLEILCNANYEYIESLSHILQRNVYDELIDRIFKATVKKIRAKDKIKLAFVTYNAAMWCGDKLYNYFADNPRYEVKVYLSIDFSKGNSESIKNDWKRGIEQFKARGINVIALDSLNAKIEKQDVIIFLNPYLETFPYSLRLNALTAETLLVNIPYSFDISGFDIYNLPIFHVLWKHFFDTQEHLSSCEKKCTVSTRGYYSGYPRLDVFFDKNFAPEFNWKMARPNAKKIIYAPHWSIDDLGVKYATFRYNYKFFYEYAKAHQEISWIIKPHPNLFKWAAASGLFPSEYAFEEYMKAWDNLPNAKVVTGAYYHDIFATSDGMILDSGSFIGEYQYTHKPMIFLTRDTQKFNDMCNELMEVTYRVDGRDLEGIAQMIQKIFIESNDEMYNERLKFFDKYCDYVKANGMTASECIYKNISNEFL